MPSDTDTAHVVVVGGGLAGVRTCEELRRQGFAGKLTLVSAESGPPYDRPPLSKGRDGAERADLRMDLVALDVTVLDGIRAAKLLGVETSTAPLRLLLDSPDVPDLTTDAVVVATGAAPILPAGWPTDPAVRVLRTKDDAVGLWAALEAAGAGARVAVLGGSWIGLEFATVASGLGAAVTIYEGAPSLLPMLPPEAGEVVQRWCNDAGVNVRLGATVESLQVDAPGSTSVADQAGVLAAKKPRITVTTETSTERYDLVLVALGVMPDTGWLADTGLSVSTKGALKVDAHLRTSDPRVIGVGDAVERWSPRYQQPVPAGHWQDARDEPVVAAASVLAALAGRMATDELGAPYDAVPYFWSEMFGHTLQFSGFVPDREAARVVVRGDLNADSWALCWLEGSAGEGAESTKGPPDEPARLLAVLACDRPRDAITARKALAAAPDGRPLVDPAALADADAPLAASLQPTGTG